MPVVAAFAFLSLNAWAQQNLITDVQVHGQRRIPAETIKARMFINPGDVYDQGAIERSFNSLWNTGYFVWTSAKILDLYRAYAPEAYTALERMMAAMGTPDEERITAEQYAAIPRMSVDYGVFSHIQRGEMLSIAADLGWADVGAWDVLRDELQASDDANVVLTDEHIGLDTRNSVVYSTTGKLIATIGLDGMVVVDTPDALLVAPADRAQDVKKIVEQLKAQGTTEYL